MSKLSFTPKRLVKLLKQNGFVFTRQNGSHAIFRNDEKQRKVVVPMHTKDIPKGTLHAILKDACISL
jgi:predicted RNA binding protein YcfA (HicA-like mRNA interferase family)